MPDPGVPDSLDSALLASPAPEAAAAGLKRVLERAPDPAALLEALCAGPGLPRALALLGLGGAPVEAYMAEPSDLLGLADPLPTHVELRAEIERADPDALRVLRRRTSLALAARELAGELGAVEAASHLSQVADAILEAALVQARVQTTRRYPAAGECELVVLALGKLGGVELNYSSDVDLVLVRGDACAAAPALAIARAFVAIVQESSARGRLYKVDLRLRPHGSTGELAPRLSAVLAYYRASGRTWERQALLKARPVCGAIELGRQLLAEVAWPQHRLDGTAIREILSLRDRIATQAPEAERDVKAGPGGIRDVEFAIQFLQLLHGAEQPSLRTTNTLEAIERLRSARLLSPEEADALHESYRFLRRLEHLLQLIGDRELTRLPRGAQLEPLARCLHRDAHTLEEELARARGRARQVLDRLLRAPFEDTPAGHDLTLQDLLLDPDQASPDRIAACLGETFRDPSTAWRLLRDLGEERNPFLAPSGRARTVLAGLAPRLLEALRARHDPDRTLRNLQRATANLGAKATVWQLLAEDPDALGLLVDLANGSDVLPAVLARHPGVFDEVVDRLLTRARPTRAEVEAEARATLAGANDPEPRLRQVRALHLLTVGALDLGGRSNVQNTARSLAEVAEGLLAAFAHHARKQASAAHGGEPAGGRLALLALGRLGGRELSYAGDADLIAIYDGSAPAPDGTQPLAFWSEVVQRVVLLGDGTPSDAGPLLEIDLRLRPGGSSGPLAIARSQALDYYRGQGPGDAARHFERLALQKLRAVAGDAQLGSELEELLSEALYQRDYRLDLWDEVEEMRRRQREAGGPDDLKLGPGGLAQVELVASALALVHGKHFPSLRQANAVTLLEALTDVGLLDPGEHLQLRTAYAFLRRVLLALRVADWKAISKLGPAPRALALRLGYVDVGQTPAQEHFLAELAFQRQQVEGVTTEVIRRERAGLARSLARPDERG